VLIRGVRELSHYADKQAAPAESRRRVEDIEQVNLVCSYTNVSDTHAPCLDLDLDMLATLTRASDGKLTCWVDAPLHRRGFQKLLATGVEAGLFAPINRAYALARAHSLDSSPRDEVLVSLGAVLGATVEECIHTAALTPGPASVVVRPGPPMKNPWPLALAGAADLVRSTHHYHLYLHVQIHWLEYVTG
jgi:hypothetical protein